VSTQSLLSTLEDDYFQGYGRIKLLSYVDRVQKWAFSHDCAQTSFLNPADPDYPHPFINTEAGKLGPYYMDATSLADSEGNPLTLERGGYPFTLRRAAYIYVRPGEAAGPAFAYGKRRLHARQHVAIHAVDGSDVETAHVAFESDPGDTTNYYCVRAFMNAIPLTAETIPMSLDSNKWFEMLVEGVNAIVEDIENGGTNRFQMFTRYWLPKWKGSMNDLAGEVVPATIPIRRVG
jgi:hypothetical protein